jgi:4-hydroxy-tetrahydrodipicolinate synthase
MLFGRLLTAMVTPFTPEDALDLATAGRLAKWLLNEGNDGVVLAGTTGESPTLSADEKALLFEAVREAVGPKVPVIANTGGNDTRSSVALTKRAETLGVSGILAVVPYYNRPSQEGMLLHFGAIAEATRLPVIIYNIPSRSSVDMSARTLLELAARHSNILGVKESSGSFPQFAQILRERSPGFTFWSGDDALFLPSLAVGGEGLISVAGHLCARELRQMLDAFLGGDVKRASALHLELSPLFARLFSFSSPSPVKWALRELGCPVGTVRPPLAPLPEAYHAVLREVIEPYRARVEAMPS